jgi:CHAD domain-containing protein
MWVMGARGHAVGHGDPAEHEVADPHAHSADVWCEWSSARAAIAGALTASVTQLRAELPRARQGVPEGVHQARVATRRLRSDLRTFADLLDPAWSGHVRHDLKHLTDALGRVRDLDVLHDRLTASLEPAGVDPHDAEGLVARLDAEREAARRALSEVLDDPGTAALVDGLCAGAHDPPTTGHALGQAERRLRPLVRRQWRKLHRRVERLGDEPPVDELHGVRLLAKRARYAAEAVTPVYGKPARRFAKAVVGVQTVLGELNDAEAAIAWLAAAAPEVDARAAAAAAALIGHERRVADERRTGWERSFAKASRRDEWLH